MHATWWAGRTSRHEYALTVHLHNHRQASSTTPASS